MAKKGALFHLIRSLSPAEKRYFRLAVQKEATVYLRLFRAIDKQQAYDEAAIRKQFRNEKFTRQLHVAKNYLSSLIMRTLRNYHAGGSARATVLALIQDAEILLTRELYDHCYYALEKAWQISLTHEYIPLQLEVHDLRRRLLLARGGGQASGLTDVIENELDLLQKAVHLNRTWDLTNNLYKKISDKDFLQESMVAKSSSRATIRSETLRRHLRYSWYFMNNQRAKAEREVNALLKMLNTLPDYIAEEPAPYVTALGNKISMLLGDRRRKEVENLLLEMRRVPDTYGLKRNSRFTVRFWLRLYNLELEYYRDAAKNEAALKLVIEIAAFLTDRAASVPGTYVLLFRLQFALIYFGAGDQKAALREINFILNDDFGDDRPDLQCAARMLNLVIHFELGNILVLRYAVDSTERFLLKHRSLTGADKVLLGLFKKLGRSERSEYARLFRAAAPGLTKTGSDYFDFGEWVRSKAG